MKFLGCCYFSLGLPTTSYVIAFFSEGVRVARDESDSPILRYNTSGQRFSFFIYLLLNK